MKFNYKRLKITEENMSNILKDFKQEDTLNLLTSYEIVNGGFVVPGFNNIITVAFYVKVEYKDSDDCLLDSQDNRYYLCFNELDIHELLKDSIDSFSIKCDFNILKDVNKLISLKDGEIQKIRSAYKQLNNAISKINLKDFISVLSRKEVIKKITSKINEYIERNVEDTLDRYLRYTNVDYIEVDVQSIVCFDKTQLKKAK